MMFEYPCKIKRIYDGDTLTCDIDLGFNIWIYNRSVRLSRIDTPEIRTQNLLEKKAAYKVRDYIREILLDKQVVLRSRELDKYGRILGDIIFNGVSISEHLLDHKLAKVYLGGKKLKWTDQELNLIVEKEI